MTERARRKAFRRNKRQTARARARARKRDERGLRRAHLPSVQEER